MIDDLKKEICVKHVACYEETNAILRDRADTEGYIEFVSDVIDDLHAQGLLMVWNHDMSAAPLNEDILTSKYHGKRFICRLSRFDGICHKTENNIYWKPTAFMLLPKGDA